MCKFLSVILASVMLYGCGCNCRYNDYLPENNPLVIPEELKVKEK